MKNIVVLVGEYKPYSSTNGNIADNLLQELKKVGYSITVITRKNEYSLPKFEVIDEIPVYRNNDWNLIIHNYCLNKINKKKFFFKFVLQIKRIIFFIPKVFRIISISKHYTKKIEKTIAEIDKKEKIDVIIPVSAPHEEVFAAMNFKKTHNNVKLLVYQLDRFSNEDALYPVKILKNKKVKRNIELELELLKECDNIFTQSQIVEHYKNNKIYNNYLKKVVKTEYPLVKNLKGEKREEEKKIIKVIYAGALYKKLRDPSYILKIMSTKIMRDSNIKLYLYAFGDCQNLINNYCKTLKETIFNKGKLPHEKIVKEMQNADILLSIGNNSVNQIPSKVFEYLSICKPIIHLYYSDQDVYLKYLKKYKYAICIKMDNDKIEENSKLLYEFCKKNIVQDIEYDMIEKQFKECTPGYVAKEFTRVIEIQKKGEDK